MKRAIFTLMGTAALLLLVSAGCGDRPGERELANAMRQLERGQLVRAKDLLEKSVNKRPGSDENALAYAYLGWVEWKLEDKESALQAFENSLRINPDRWETLYNIGVLQFSLGNYSRAEERLRMAHELAPAETRPLEYLARLYMDNRNWDDAWTMLQKALSQRPKSPGILTSLALVELERDGPAAALSYLMQALEISPEYPPALYNLAALYERIPGRKDEAVSFYQQYIGLGRDLPKREQARSAVERLRRAPPDNDETVIARPEPPPEPQPEPAERVDPSVRMDEIIERARRHADAGEMELAAGLCIRAATEARLQGRPDLERRGLNTAVEIAPDSARAHFAMGRYLAARNRHEEALQSFRRAVDIDGSWVPALLAQGRVSAHVGQYDEARVAFSRALEADPSNPDPLWELARFFDETLNMTNRAITSYREFMEKFPDDTRADQALDRLRALGNDA